MTEQGILTSWRPQREAKSRCGKNVIEWGALTSWRPQREAQVRTWKETDRGRDTHFLETTEGGTTEDMERMTKQGALTL